MVVLTLMTRIIINGVTAMKHKHRYWVIAEHRSLDNRNFEIFNITIKKTISLNELISFRRGFAFIQDFIDFKNINFAINKKGLRKFHDTIPQSFNIKTSYFTTNKYHITIKKSLNKDKNVE